MSIIGYKSCVNIPAKFKYRGLELFRDKDLEYLLRECISPFAHQRVRRELPDIRHDEFGTPNPGDAKLIAERTVKPLQERIITLKSENTTRLHRCRRAEAN